MRSKETLSNVKINVKIYNKKKEWVDWKTGKTKIEKQNDESWSAALDVREVEQDQRKQNSRGSEKVMTWREGGGFEREQVDYC